MSDRSASGEQSELGAARADAALDIAAGGPAARTRRLAREELHATPHPHQETHKSNADAHFHSSSAGDDTWREEVDLSFALSPRYIDPKELEALQQRPPVSFAVQNAATTAASRSATKTQTNSQKEDAVMTASATAASIPSRFAIDATSDRTTAAGKLRTRQSWHSPVHVPLSHRKLVTTPTIFGGVAPFPPVIPHPPSSNSEGKRKLKIVRDSPRGVHKLAKLSPKCNNQVQSSSGQLSNQ